MRFTEFEKSQPQLTEEQHIVIEYCQGNISKEDAVNKLKEGALQSPTKQSKTSDWFKWNDKGGWSGFNWGGDWRDQLNKATLGAVDSRDEQDAQDAEAIAKRQGPRSRISIAPGSAKASDLEFDSFDDEELGDEELTGGASDDDFGGPPGRDNMPAKPSGPTGPDPESQTQGGDVPAPDTRSFGQAFAAARKQHGGPGGKFTYKGKDYQTNVKGEKYVKNPKPVGPNKTLELQKKLRAAGADIKADGLMGPNTRAAMKKYGIGTAAPKSAPKGLAPKAQKPALGLSPGALGGKLPAEPPGLSPGALGGKLPAAPKPPGLSPGALGGKLPAEPPGLSPGALGGKLPAEPKPSKPLKWLPPNERTKKSTGKARPPETVSV